MNWLGVVDKVIKKPPVFVIITIGVLFVLLVGKWQIELPLQALWFFIGGLVGIYVLEIAETVFKLEPSPFRTIFFSLGLAVVALFLMVSTREFAAKGLAVSLFLNLYMLFVDDWRKHHSVQSWYNFFFGTVSEELQKNSVFLYGVVVVVLCSLFVIS
jgi:hypothetical protein